MDISEQIKGDNTFLTLVNFWPSGWRNEWTIYVQNLLSDGDVDAIKLQRQTVSVNSIIISNQV